MVNRKIVTNKLKAAALDIACGHVHLDDVSGRVWRLSQNAVQALRRVALAGQLRPPTLEPSWPTRSATGFKSPWRVHPKSVTNATIKKWAKVSFHRSNRDLVLPLSDETSSDLMASPVPAKGAALIALTMFPAASVASWATSVTVPTASQTKPLTEASISLIKSWAWSIY